MKKRVFSLLLALSLTLGLAVSASAADTGYSDVPEGHWSAESVRRATELGLFNGVGGGKFGRGQPISRAAFVTALVRLFDWQEITPTQATFTDVTADRWVYSAVETGPGLRLPGRSCRPVQLPLHRRLRQPRIYHGGL